MCHLCGKCKTAKIPIGECMIVPKYTWDNGTFRKTTKIEKNTIKFLTRAAILARMIIYPGGTQ